MKLCAPTNFDDNLVPALVEAGTYEVYGKLTRDVVGGGRTSHVLPEVDQKRLAAHVKVVKDAGIRFNYLLNAASMGGIETTAAGYRKIRRVFDMLSTLKVDSITVTNPVLLQLAKRHYPWLEVKVSSFANVSSPLQARFWEDMGADVITLSPVLLNRELALIKEITSSVKAECQLIANNNCLQSCPFYLSHANLVSHTSQKGHWSRGYMIDYCLVNCRMLRLLDPANYIRGDWIRPEDIPIYEALGVRQLKLVARSNPTKEIIARVKAYAVGRFDGNLLELVEHGRDFKLKVEQTIGAKVRMIRTFARPLLANPIRMKELAGLVLPHEPFIYIDNRKLDGFLDYFKTHSCLGRDCSKCGYCEEVARQVITVNEATLDDYRERYRSALEKFLDGYYFRWKG